MKVEQSNNTSLEYGKSRKKKVSKTKIIDFLICNSCVPEKHPNEWYWICEDSFAWKKKSYIAKYICLLDNYFITSELQNK